MNFIKPCNKARTFLKEKTKIKILHKLLIDCYLFKKNIYKWGKKYQFYESIGLKINSI